MKVTFFSNSLIHHQLPFCLEMQKKLGDNFKFVSCEPTKQEQLNLGYEDLNKEYPFVITTYDNDVNKDLAMKLSLESDIVILGSAPEKYIKNRMQNNKITFRYAERVFKQGVWHILSPRAIFNMITRHTIYRYKPLYMLSASAYNPYDMGLVFAYKNKSYKWGYFPEDIKYCNFDDLMNSKKKNSLLWAGRMIDWKHPEKAIYIAKKLKENGIDFELNMIGTGNMKDQIEKMILEYDLTNEVHMLGAMNPKKVRQHMEASRIFLFTSDFNEGWGAVLNESMNSGCAVVASHAIGAVPYLIDNNVNGVIYNNADINDLYQKVLGLIENPNKTYEIGKNAYKTIIDEWNATVATERLVLLCEALLNGNDISVEKGPCSKANKIKNNWFTKQ